MDTTHSPAQRLAQTARRALASLALIVAVLSVAPSASQAREARVVSGTPVGPADVATNGRWSAVVSIVAIAGNQSRLCTGTLITRNWVVTAAHCLGRPENPALPLAADDVIVTAGSTTVHSDDMSPDTVAVHLHPLWEWSTAAWDVALIELASTQAHAPMELPDPTALASYETGPGDNVVGFGRTSGLDGGSSGTLHSGRLEPLTTAECGEARPGSDAYADCLIPGPTRQMACFGDSGGPVVRFDPRRGGAPVLWGVTSIGPSMCQTNSATPTFHTRIAAVRGWIEQTLAASTYSPALSVGTNTMQSNKTPLGGAGIDVFKAHVKRKPTRARAGKLRLTASFIGGDASGKVFVERCRGSRCTTTASRSVAFQDADAPKRTIVSLPRCTPRATIRVKLHVRAREGQVQDRVTRRVARCS